MDKTDNKQGNNESKMTTGCNLYQDVNKQDDVDSKNGSMVQAGKAPLKRGRLSWIKRIRRSWHCRQQREERRQVLKEEEASRAPGTGRQCLGRVGEELQEQPGVRVGILFQRNGKPLEGSKQDTGVI